MKKIALCALAAIGAGTIVWAAIHRHIISAAMKEDPLPKPPAWHYACGLHKKKA